MSGWLRRDPAWLTGPWSAEATATTTALAQVANLTADATHNSLTLTWDVVDGAANYLVQWSTESGNFGSAVSMAVVTASHTISNLQEGTNYYVRVRARPLLGNMGAWSAELATATILQPPARVTGLSLNADSSTEITVTWSEADRATGYLVQWADTEANLGTVNGSEATVAGSGTLTYQATGLTANTAYYVRVSAQRTDADDGIFSVVQSATSLLSAPGNISGLASTSATGTTLVIDWDDATNATGYVIQWSTTSGSFNASDQATPTASTYTITGLTVETTYYFRVRAARTGGDAGAWSSQASATTQLMTLGRVSGISTIPPSSTEMGLRLDCRRRC